MATLLHHWISIQAQRRPDAVAVVMRNERVTYGQLEQRTNQLARLLKAVGCRRGDRVAFAIPKCPAAIVSIGAILKADCIHVPIDIAGPAPRVAKILHSSEPRCVLATNSSLSLLETLSSERDCLTRVHIGWMGSSADGAYGFNPRFYSDDANGFSAANLESENRSDDAAHILYTSGSTGEPKGVVITHANVTHFVKWAVRYFGMNETDRISCHPPLHFDLATFDIFGGFAAGAEIHLVPPEVSLLPNKVAAFIRDAQLTQWFSVPSVLNYMAKFDVVEPNDFPELRRLLWCGEVFPTPSLMYWMKRLPRVSFTNLYGPTEATIASSYYTVPQCPKSPTESIPIGVPCPGEQFMVLGNDLKPVPQGEIGDLYIAGVGLSPGYWRDADKTTAAFVPYTNDQRIYRTGDLARVGVDGLVYFVGRSDTQIKSRGYRIELGEVEASLNSLPDIKECVVVAVPTDGFEGNVICCAYVAQDNVDTNTAALRQKLSALIPAYMLPSTWACVPELPTNANGKADRRKLREWFAIQLKKVAQEPGCHTTEAGQSTAFAVGTASPQF